jgi:hypothetical protein
MLPKEEMIKNAIEVEWDDDVIKNTYQMSCQCGGKFKLINYHRNPHLNPLHLDALVLNSDPAVYDVIECACLNCKTTRYFSFKPRKIHNSVRELIQNNEQYIRL